MIDSYAYEHIYVTRKAEIEVLDPSGYTLAARGDDLFTSFQKKNERKMKKETQKKRRSENCELNENLSICIPRASFR